MTTDGPHHRHRTNKVYYLGGWFYKLHGDVRGPFKTAEDAGIAMAKEKRELKVVRKENPEWWSNADLAMWG